MKVEGFGSSEGSCLPCAECGALQVQVHSLIPASIHHGCDSSPGHWSREPDFCRNGFNFLWDIVFMVNTRANDTVNPEPKKNAKKNAVNPEPRKPFTQCLRAVLGNSSATKMHTPIPKGFRVYSWGGGGALLASETRVANRWRGQDRWQGEKMAR